MTHSPNVGRLRGHGPLWEQVAAAQLLAWLVYPAANEAEDRRHFSEGAFVAWLADKAHRDPSFGQMPQPLPPALLAIPTRDIESALNRNSVSKTLQRRFQATGLVARVIGGERIGQAVGHIEAESKALERVWAQSRPVVHLAAALVMHLQSKGLIENNQIGASVTVWTMIDDMPVERIVDDSERARAQMIAANVDRTDELIRFEIVRH